MFFDPGTIKEASLSMSHFREWAGEIANSYFRGSVPPTVTLTKIASLEELTPHYVEILAAEANKEIHKHKYASAKDKYFAADFPLADAKRAIAQLQADGGETKVAAYLPEPTVKGPELDMYKAFGIKAPEMDKTAEVKKGLKIASVRGELLEQKTADRVTMAKFAAESAEARFIKAARQEVLSQDTPTERLKALCALDEFVKSAGIHEGRAALAKLAFILGREGLISPRQSKVACEYFVKEADCKAPEELISDWLPAKIVNGEHPLYVTLKTFRDKKRDLLDAENDYKIVQDKFNVVRQKVRAL